MEQQNVVYIPPIEIHDYQQFRVYAKRARMVTFEAEYYEMPFEPNQAMDSTQWLKALKIYAIGVNVDGLPLTIVHLMPIPRVAKGTMNPTMVEVATSLKLAKIIRKLETDLHAIPGNPAQPPIHELWMKTLR